jgi:hypothetical protein
MKTRWSSISSYFEAIKKQVVSRMVILLAVSSEGLSIVYIVLLRKYLSINSTAM